MVFDEGRRARRATTALLAVLALAASGCGMLADPSVRTPTEVLDALLGLREGAELRATVDLRVDRDELRSVLRGDAEARRLLAEMVADGVGGAAGGDVDDLLADLEVAQERLGEHALLLASGTDGSVRIATEHRGRVWADLRLASDLEPGDDPAEGFWFATQLQVDWATAAELFDQPDLLGDLDEAAAELAPLLGDTPDLAAVERVLLALLGGELVGIDGHVGSELLTGLGLDGPTATGPAELLRGIEPRELAATALSFGDVRLQDQDTLVEASIEVRALGELVLDAVAAAPDAAGLTFEEVQEARAELATLPQRLQDVATLHFDRAGVLRTVRVDLLDVALQLGRALEPGDEDVATLARLAGELDGTGLFLDVEVQTIGTLRTVLGDPAAALTPAELAEAVGALLLAPFGDVDAAAALEELQGTAALDPPAPALGAGAVRPGDCLSLEVLLGRAAAGAEPTIACAEPHRAEAYALVDFGIGGGTHADAVRTELPLVACLAAFEDFIGTPWQESDLVTQVLLPTPVEFDAGLREAVCYVESFDPVTGTLRGSGG